MSHYQVWTVKSGIRRESLDCVRRQNENFKVEKIVLPYNDILQRNKYTIHYETVKYPCMDISEEYLQKTTGG